MKKEYFFKDELDEINLKNKVDILYFVFKGFLFLVMGLMFGSLVSFLVFNDY